MAVRKKPKVRSERDVDALIAQGGSVAGSKEEKKKPISVQLRVSEKILNEIDSLVALRKIKTPRHMWLLEAIHEKIEREATG